MKENHGLFNKNTFHKTIIWAFQSNSIRFSAKKVKTKFCKRDALSPIHRFIQKPPEKGPEALSVKINNTLHSEFQTIK